jgi:hypothetical protein
MKDYLLLRTQKNELLECVKEAGLNHKNFEWGEDITEVGSEYKPVGTYPVSIVRYLHTDFYFKFDRDPFDKFFCISHPRTRELTETSSSYAYKWEGALIRFKEWLSRLKEQEVPDLWEQLKEYAPDETFIGTAEISNAPFSYSEAENIIGSLDKLQTQIEENFNLRGQQLAFVKRQIDYLKDAAKRQGRKDWMHTSIGVIVTIAMDLALSPEKTKLLWDLLKSCFAGLLQLPAP